MPAAQRPGMPRADDLASTWAALEEGVAQIMVSLNQGMQPARYMELYTIIYNYCTQNKMQRFGDAGSSAGSRGAHLMGAELYDLLKEYVKLHLGHIARAAKAHTGEALLQFYTRKWQDFTVSAGFIHHIFRYLNRNWVKRELDEGRTNMHDVYTFCLVLWKSIVFDDLQAEIMTEVLKLIRRQRSGMVVESSLIKHVVDSYVLLGLDETDPGKSTLDVYQQFFHVPFIAETSKFYEQESAAAIAELSVPDYMKKAEARIKEEEGRVELYLHVSSTSKLMAACDQALIAAHAEVLQQAFPDLIEHDRQDDMQRMYKLLGRIAKGLDPMRKAFEEHVRKTGLASVEKNCPDVENVEPKAYVNALLTVHTAYNGLIERAFNSDSDFVKSLDKACGEFMNRNKACGFTSAKSPELLSKYCDGLLKKSAKNPDEQEVEAVLQDVMTVFKYVEDKDVFIKFYTRQLSRRLVNDLSNSDDAEASMLSKLKEACGVEYTKKLQRMFGDITTSREHQDTFRTYLAQKDEDAPAVVDADFKVLQSGSWPLYAPTTEFLIPEALLKTVEQFAMYYDFTHNGRKLQWLWQHSKADIKVNYLPSKYTFQVSTYQLAILMAYNTTLSLTYTELQAITGITAKDQLDGALGILVKAKVLLLSETDGQRYSLNTNFKNKKLRINLNLPIKSEQKQESDDTHKHIEGDRKHMIESAIVRIMKARKQMKHTLLVQETINQLKSRFQPKISDIKKSIDGLLERDYIERAEGDAKDMYSYLA
ncbi:cullin protein [Protomyces lactucae-debilis]|uniref:Cullin-1 n=1 Tax=Protomyces lactucae-debilis TaxID=2754530 RepID=A0A1Y2FSB2_PROLT|nr:cullin protein [Protomyces lactucae-debilis]ORY86878.1 cullin protein [Protomyces lactucae-debilis]